MRKIRNFVFGGLQQKIFNLMLVTVILLVAAYTAVILYQMKNLQKTAADTNEKHVQAIRETTKATMESVVRSTMGTDTQMEAYIADNIFKSLGETVTVLGEYAEELLSDPAAAKDSPVLPPDREKDGELTVQLLTEEGIDAADPEVSEQIALYGNMADILSVLYRNAEVNSCFIGTEDGFLLIADEISGSKFLDSGEIMDFPVRQRQWYTGAKEAGKLYFTDVEIDAFTGKIGIVCSMPVYRDGKLEAVVGTDLFLDSMAAAVESTGSENSESVCILNQDGHVIFSPESMGIFHVETSVEAEDLRSSGSTELSEFVQDAMQGATDVREVQVDDTVYYMAGAPLETVGWTLLSVIKKDTVMQPAVTMEEQSREISAEAIRDTQDRIGMSRKTLLALLLLIFIAGSIAALTLAKRIVKPLNTITERISGLQGKDLQFRMEDVYRTGDEIEVLAESFADLSSKTVKYIDEVKRITAEKERIGAELGMATAIQASQLPHLFPAFPDRPEFDIYASMTPAKEVGGDFYDFFLIDNDHIGLVMSDVAGKGVPAALFMMIARILIRNRIQSGESPKEALRNVNNQLLESNEAELFVTVWLAVLEISTGRGIAANAGHEHPVLRRAGKTYRLVRYRHSPAVAVLPEIEYSEHEFVMYPGDSLFVYTDGVAEATDAEKNLFGTSRMLEALNRDPDADPETILRNVKEGIQAFTKDEEQFDDITMMCLKYIGPEGGRQKRTEALYFRENRVENNPLI